MLHKTVGLLRQVYGLSKAAFGKKVGLSGQYVSMLESGKNKKMSQPAINQVCSVFHVSPDWLISGIIDKNVLYEISSTLRINSDRINVADLAQRLSVPMAFIQGIVDGEISPSDDFFKRIMKEGIGVEPQGDLKKRITEIENKRRYARIIPDEDYEQLGEKYRDLLEKYVSLEERKTTEIEELKRRINELEGKG